MRKHKGQTVAEYGYEISGNVIEILSFEIERSIDSTIIKVITPKDGSESLLETFVEERYDPCRC